ncbi:hypothetical protein [Arthrobacter gyeryongensis]
MAHIGQFALEAHAAMRGLPPFNAGLRREAVRRGLLEPDRRA